MMFYVMITLLFISCAIVWYVKRSNDVRVLAVRLLHHPALSSCIFHCLHLPILLFHLSLINTVQKHAICTGRRSCHSVYSHTSPHSRRANCTVCLWVSAYHLHNKFIIYLNPVPPELFANSCSSATCKVLKKVFEQCCGEGIMFFFLSLSLSFSLLSPYWLWSVTESFVFLGIHMCWRPPAVRAAADSFIHTHTS